MREILFRGKRTDGGEWVYGYPVGWQDEEGDISIVDSRFGACIDESGNLMMLEAPFVAKVDPSTVGQYTGITDKNGIKIFEGDILRVVTNYYSNRNEHKITVNFEEIENDSFGEPYTIGYCIMGGEWEIIGNIYDNPELLKEAT